VLSRPAIGLALLTAALHLWANGDYGYFRDDPAALEAYPIDTSAPKSTSNIFVGTASTFARAGFKEVFRRASARPIMRHAENVTGPDTRARPAALYRYNEALRRYLLDGHHMDTDSFHSLSGSTIIDRFGYRECAPKR
jgi:hypothetical protein